MVGEPITAGREAEVLAAVAGAAERGHPLTPRDLLGLEPAAVRKAFESSTRAAHHTRSAHYPRKETDAMTNIDTLAVISEKGGAGKTTLAVNLAVAALLAGRRPCVLDLDPQASACLWAERRDPDQAWPLVLPAQAPIVARAFAAAGQAGADLVLMDAKVQAESAGLAALRRAGLALVPCRPGYFDLLALEATFDLAAIAGVPALVALNACPARGALAGEACTVLERGHIAVAAARIGNRAAFVHSLTNGRGVCEHEPRGKAAAEIAALWDQIAIRLAAPEGAQPRPVT